MKKFLALGLVICMAALSVQAKALTDEQKALKKEMLEKYDTNKDGKLDKEEMSKMTPEDKAAWKKAFPHHHKKADSSSNAGTSSSSAPSTSSK